MNDDHRQNDFLKAIGRSVDMLRDWAETNPEEYNPTDAIEDIASEVTTDESLRDRIRNRLWDEWTAIEGERRLADDFESDLG